MNTEDDKSILELIWENEEENEVKQLLNRVDWRQTW